MKTLSTLSAFLFVSSLSAAASAQNLVQNLNFSAAIDAVAPMNFDNSEDNRLGIRSAEFMIFGAVDPVFDAKINFAAHNEEGEYHAELHEAFISSSKLIPNSTFKIGTFFLGIGRLNQFHQHDWPFISAPIVQEKFLGDEGVNDTGAEYTYLLPTDSYMDITVGVTDGYKWGHEDVEMKPQTPVYYVHPTAFINIDESKGLLLGTTYLSRTGGDHIQTQLIGLDATFKNKEQKLLKWLLQTEVWYQIQNNKDDGFHDESIGAYVYPQYGIDENWSVGMRFDAFSDLSQKFDGTDENQKNLEYAVVPTVAYKTSEFSTLRLAYTHQVAYNQNQSDDVQRILELQFIAILGAHPAHAF
jgi:hypothetical protein